MIIYKTINLVNGKIYIGQSIHNRPDYLGSGRLLINAIKKYGKTLFKKEILCECETRKELNEKEKYWIKKLNSRDSNIGYNLSVGGQNPGKRKNKMDQEWCNNISKGKMGSIPWNKGKNYSLSDETKKKLKGRPPWNKGKIGKQKHSEETKIKMSAAHKGKNHWASIKIEFEGIKFNSRTDCGKYFGNKWNVSPTTAMRRIDKVLRREK